MTGVETCVSRMGRFQFSSRHDGRIKKTCASGMNQKMGDCWIGWVGWLGWAAASYMAASRSRTIGKLVRAVREDGVMPVARYTISMGLRRVTKPARPSVRRTMKRPTALLEPAPASSSGSRSDDVPATPAGAAAEAP